MSCTDAAGNRIPLSADPTRCTRVEYGDPFDIMGGWRSGEMGFSTYYRHQFSVYSKLTLKLVPQPPFTPPDPTNTILDPVNVRDVASDGVFELAPNEHASTDVQALRMLAKRFVDQWGNENEYFYYLEFRQPYGRFDDCGPSDPVATGVSIRLVKRLAGSGSVELVDTTADTTSFLDSALGVARTFDDPFSGLSITVLSAAPSGATVRVRYPCALVPGRASRCHVDAEQVAPTPTQQ